MPQSLSQIQQQKAEQQLRLTQQQLQVVKLLEMPIAEFEQQVKREMMENPALEEGQPADETERRETADGGEDDTGEDPYGDDTSDPYGEDDLSLLAETSYGEDDLPVYSAAEERERRPLGDAGSFIQQLESQVMNYELSEDEQRVLRYLIGSLDARGFIDRDVAVVADELAFREYLDVSPDDVERMLRVLQSFDPAGIGARSVQECLLIQIDRQLNQEDSSLPAYKERALRLARTLIADHYGLLLGQNTERLRDALGVSAAQLDALLDLIRKLNVSPGLSLGESPADRVQTRIPDFIVETDVDGRIEMRLNTGEVPRLHVSRDYVDQLRRMRAKTGNLTRGEREGMAYTRQKVEAARMFIESVKQRRRTLHDTMQAIIDLQRAYILSRDENDKTRLVLDDVAKAAGYDVSTVSRVCASKCALLDGRIYPLSDFFKLTRKNAAGEEVDSRQVREMIREIVNGEDKGNPYPDDIIMEMMAKRGMRLARRTIAKYRKEMGIPSVKIRKG